ncbi:11131_t:CDS:2 [Funneliformis caledonium]|uniref:DNA replication ATP-dependent helicase/nuclease n=1 Tax=Funneliformis caledonium TaxID=1117310 RepID=A0A9N8Z8X4_9GLOM|nr:11131_t:CDS:2 [Funneliformis caledonium]
MSSDRVVDPALLTLTRQKDILVENPRKTRKRQTENKENVENFQPNKSQRAGYCPSIKVPITKQRKENIDILVGNEKKETPQEQSKFHNLLVIHVEDAHKSKKVTLINEDNLEEFFLILCDSWMDTKIFKNDTVSIIGEFKNRSCEANDSNDVLIIVNPDVLVSSTCVSEAYSCMRRAILKDRISSGNFNTPSAVLGTLSHEFIQHCLKNNDFSPSFMDSKIKQVMKKNIPKIYFSNLKESKVIKELADKKIIYRNFAECYVSQMPKFDLGKVESIRGDIYSLICISKTLDVEERIWSPTFGLKGILDASIEVKVLENRTLKKYIMPLEIKTAWKEDFTHNLQTILYCVMMNDHYKVNVESGLLYYVKNNNDRNDQNAGKLKRIHVSIQELREILKTRNEITWYLSNRQRHILPPMIKDPQACGKCNIRSTCFLYHKAIENGKSEDSGVVDLFNESTAHLGEVHLEFFRKWEELIKLEEEDVSQVRPQIWNTSSLNRDSTQSLYNMHLDLNSIIEFPGSTGLCQLKCKFFQVDCKESSILYTQFCVNDFVVVSSEQGHYALATGFVNEIAPDYICLTLDRKPCGGPKQANDFDIESCHSFLGLQDRTEQEGILKNPLGFDLATTSYRIDRDELTSSIKLVRQNLVSLLMDVSTRKLRKLIVNLEAPQYGRTFSTLINYNDLKKDLNEDQVKAFELALNAEDYALILGMPGTGKTFTIAQIIKALLRRGDSVLLASYTHSAVDNVLSKLSDYGEEILRIGDKSKVHKSIWPQIIDNNKFESIDEFSDFIETRKVVATTCLGMNNPIFTKRRFDYCIIDEATQITLPTCIGPLRFADRFLLVGDHNQLQPLVRRTEAIKKGMEKSLFKMFTEIHPNAVANLRYQYRMNEEIMNLSNSIIYDSNMLSGSTITAQTRLCIPRWNEGFLSQFHDPEYYCCHESCWLKDVIDPERPLIMIDTDNLLTKEFVSNGKYQNDMEVILVEHSVKALLAGGVPAKEIGIITPFRSQLKHIAHRFKGCSELEVSTIDRFQGREKQVIVLSLVRSNSELKVGNLLEDYRRINVAITRAKFKLIIVGSRSTLWASSILRNLINYLENNNMIYQLSNNGSPYWHDIPLFVDLSNVKDFAEVNNKGNKASTTKRYKSTNSMVFVETILKRNPIMKEIMNEDSNLTSIT